MADKTPSVQVNKNTVKNPLLSSSVVGLSLEDLTNRAVLLPVAPNSALQSTQDANTNPPPSNPQPPPPAAPAAAKDDFFFEEYLSRLQNTRLPEPVDVAEPRPAEATRYVSAPINSHVDENCNLQADALEEINLNEESPQHSITADIAQNFSQLPSVLPQVASAVFGSFTSMLSSKSREITPDVGADTGYPAQAGYQAEYPAVGGVGHQAVQGYSSVGVGHVGMEKEVAAPMEPPLGGPPTTFRITTKKKAYAQIPGLSTQQSGPVPGFGTGQSGPIPANYNVFVPNFTADNTASQPSSESSDNAQCNKQNPSFTPTVGSVHEDKKIENINKVVTDSLNIIDPTLAMNQTVGCEMQQENYNVNKCIAPQAAPPPTFPAASLPSGPAFPPKPTPQPESGGAILPPSVKRRLAGHQPVPKAPDSTQHAMPNFFVPVLNQPYDGAAPETPHSLANVPPYSLAEVPPRSSANPALLNTLETAPPSSWPNMPPSVVPNVPQSCYNPPVASLTSNLWSPYQAPEGKINETNVLPPVSVYNPGFIPPGSTVMPPISDVTQTPAPTFFNTMSSQAQVNFPARPSPDTLNSIVNPPAAPKEPVKVPEPPKFAGSGVNYRMTKKRPQYYSGPIEGFGSISNNIKPTLPPVEIPTAQNMALFNTNPNESQQSMPPACFDNVPSRLEISRPVDPLTQPNDSVNQVPTIDYHATAFDLSRNTTDSYEPPKQEPIGFGLIGSLKSKLGSFDINKIQNTVTTFFDPAYNEDKSVTFNANQNVHTNTGEMVGQSFDQGISLDIHVPSAPTNIQQTFDQGYGNQIYSTPQYQQYPDQYNAYQQPTANYPSISGNPTEAYYGIPAYQATQENTNANKTTNENALNQQVPPSSFFDTQISTETVATENIIVNPIKDNLGHGDTELHSPANVAPNLVNPVSLKQAIVLTDDTNSNLTDLYEPQRQSSLMPLFRSSNANEDNNVSIIENQLKCVTLRHNETQDEMQQNCTDFFDKYPNKAGGDNFDTDNKLKQDSKETDELSICGTCREIDSPVPNIEPENLTNQLIENITAPIQLSNPVEVPLTESNEVMDGNFEYAQCVGYTTLSADEARTDPETLPIKPFGWTDTPLKNPSVLLDHCYNFEVIPDVPRFFGCPLKNASDEIKAEIIHAQDPMDNIAGTLDVHSIEQDAKEDFFEEYVIEPSETDDDKIETRERERTSDDPVPEIDSFTNRVEKFKQSEEISEPKDVKLTEENTLRSPVITMASYFDTGNYAADTHYRNSLTSPSSLGTFNVSSPHQTTPALPSFVGSTFHQSDYNELNFDTISIPGAPYQKNEDFKLIAPPSSHKLEETSKKGMASEPKLYHKDNFNLFPEAGHEIGGCNDFYTFDNISQTDNFVNTLTDHYLRRDSNEVTAMSSIFSSLPVEDQRVPFYATDYDIDPIAAGVQDILEYHACQTLTDHTTTFTYSRSQEITRTDPITSREAMYSKSGFSDEFATSSASAYFDNIPDANQRRVTDSETMTGIFASGITEDNLPATIEKESKVDANDDVHKTSEDDDAKSQNNPEPSDVHSIQAAFGDVSQGFIEVPQATQSQTGANNTQVQNPFTPLQDIFAIQGKSSFESDVTIKKVPDCESQTDGRDTITFSQAQHTTPLQEKFDARSFFDVPTTHGAKLDNQISAQTSIASALESTSSPAPVSQVLKAHPTLPDPMSFFSAQEPAKQPETMNRLASYFSSPPQKDTTKSFFELSQSQNHLRHEPERLTADQYSATLDLMKDLTSVQNFRPSEEQVVRTVNYLFVEYDKTKDSIGEQKNTTINKTVVNEEQNGNKSKPFFNCMHCYNLIVDSGIRVDVKTNRQFKVKETMDGSNSERQNGESPTSNADAKNVGHSVSFDMPIEEERDENVSVTSEERVTSEYSPVEHHWFYRVDVEGKSIWKGFSMGNSKRLEDMYQSPDLTEQTLVATDGGRYDVNVMGRLRVAVYWTEKPTNVRRCSWFYKGHTDARYVPYSEDIADKLEEEYRRGVTTGEWHRRLALPNNEAVVMHAPSVMVHFLQSGGSDAWGAPSLFAFNNTKKVYRGLPDIRLVPDVCDRIDHVVLLIHGAGEWSRQRDKIQAASRPRVRRGRDLAEVEDEEPSAIGHLLLLCHGVGSACDMRFRSVEEVVDDFRATTLQLIQAHYRNSYDNGTVGRVEVLPISWHSCVHRGAAGVDRRLARLTLASIPRLRSFTNDTVLDVLLYTSPVFCQTIVDTVCSEINRVHALFRARNPSFTGGVSLGGHSLGSVILYDLLCHQSRDQSSSAADKRAVAGAAGTGQPTVRFPALHFTPQALYALGSPIAIFECIRGVESLGEDFGLPGDINFFNIFHPYDPIAYRIEPLINPKLQYVPPFLIPHHKGRKRMHLELKETVARFSADLRQRVVESVKATWYNMWRSPAPTGEQLAKVVEEELEKEELVEEAKVEVNDEEAPSTERFGRLNKGRRVDYVLQEAPFEMINEYLFAMSSHVCYWESEDTMLMILREIYSRMGVLPDCAVPPPTLTVQRARRDEASTSAGHDSS